MGRQIQIHEYLKQNKELSRFILESYPCVNKFLVVSVSSNSRGFRDILKMSKMKLLNAFQLATQNLTFSLDCCLQ